MLNTIRLVKKNIKVHFKNINKPFLIVINNEVIRYIDIKKELYYLKITNSSTLLLNFENLYSLLAIDQDKDNDLETNIKYYFISDLYIRKKSKD